MLPQMLDILKDCNIICASIVDLYDTIQVSRPDLQVPGHRRLREARLLWLRR